MDQAKSRGTLGCGGNHISNTSNSLNGPESSSLSSTTPHFTQGEIAWQKWAEWAIDNHLVKTSGGWGQIARIKDVAKKFNSAFGAKGGQR